MNSSRIYIYYIIFCCLGLSEQEIRKIREAIANAGSLEEVERLQRLLQSGQIPGQDNAENGKIIVFSVFYMILQFFL